MPESETVAIDIKLPLPLDIVATLTSLVGAAYPSATVSTDSPRGIYRLLVEPADRRHVAAETALTLKAEADPALNGTLVSQLVDDTFEFSLPSDSSRALAEWALSVLLVTDGAVNYVEQTAIYGDRKLAVVACWSPQQTPHQLRLEAERTATSLRAEVAQLRAELEELRRTGG